MTDIKFEKAGFEMWWAATGNDPHFNGTEPPSSTWYYFDDEVDGAWQAWLARSILAAAPVAAQEPKSPMLDEFLRLANEAGITHLPITFDEASQPAQGERPPEPNRITEVNALGEGGWYWITLSDGRKVQTYYPHPSQPMIGECYSDDFA